MSTPGGSFLSFASSLEPVDDYLNRALALIEGAVRRRWRDGLLTRDPDGVFTSVLGAEHVEQLMQQQPARVDEILADHDYGTGTALGAFIHTHRLTPSEADLIAVLLAAETDPRVGRLIAYVGGNQAQYTVTLDLVLELIYRPRHPHRHAAAAHLHEDLAPHRPARRLGFLLVDGQGARSALSQGIRLHPRLTAWLLGHQTLDADLIGRSRLRPPSVPLGEVDPVQLDEAVAALGAEGRFLLVDGPPRSGREMLLDFAAARLERPLLVVSMRQLSADGVTAAFREALLQNAILAFIDAAELDGGEPRTRLRECVNVFPATVALVGAVSIAPQAAEMRPLTTLEIRVPPHSERLRLWQTYLGGGGMTETDLTEVAAVYNLGISGIISAARAARERATFERRAVDRRDVSLAVRQLFDADLSTIATRVEVTQTWDDLVLPDEIGDTIVSIIDRIRHRSRVLGAWGFARKVGKGLGVTVLFGGEPGTGKSMACGLIAREVGLDLYVIDLARVTSKWIGETEKNLGRAFDAAEAGHVLLLFDEADTILGKRSEVKSSNDRNANLETNYILARLEQFQGIALFTTNLASAIDPAVSRRMSAQVTFPFPDVDTRAELWRRMIPKETPLHGAIDFHRLAKNFELSGGFIRNVVLRAAYAAAQEGKGLSMIHLERAARSEYADRGSLLIGGRLV